MSITVSVLSVSADMKNFMAVFYRYRPIRKLSLSGFISNGRILIQGVPFCCKMAKRIELQKCQ